VFYITFQGHAPYGNNAVKGHFLVFHSRGTGFGNNNYCRVFTLIGEYIALESMTDALMVWRFGSPEAQEITITILSVG
jgi:hypothetical protein